MGGIVSTMTHPSRTRISLTMRPSGSHTYASSRRAAAAACRPSAAMVWASRLICRPWRAARAFGEISGASIPISRTRAVLAPTRGGSRQQGEQDGEGVSRQHHSGCPCWLKRRAVAFQQDPVAEAQEPSSVELSTTSGRSRNWCLRASRRASGASPALGLRGIFTNARHLGSRCSRTCCCARFLCGPRPESRPACS